MEDVDKNGLTPLMLAVECNSFEVAKNLIELGANIESVSF